MTIESSTSRIAYTGSGTTGPFSIPWLFYANTDIVAQTTIIATGVTTTLVLNVDYTLVNTGTATGNSLTLTNALASTSTITIYLDPPITQLSDYVSGAAFPSATIEEDFDRSTQIAQRLQQQVSNALRAPDSETTASMSLPSSVDRALKYLLFDSSGNPIVSTGTGVDTGLRGDLAAGISDLVGSTAIKYDQTAAELAVGVTPSNTAIPSTDAEGNNNILRYGPDLTGVLDSRTAFANASSVGITTKVVPGTYLINSDITIAPSLIFLTGAILKPAAGVTITLSSQFTAPASQIFDLSLGGMVLLPRDSGEVRVEWWGAKGDLVKINNEVPFNQAIWALYQTVGGTFGGYVVCGRGDFYFTDTVYWPNNISVRGHAFLYTAWFANVASWSGSPYMHQCQAQTALQFTTVLAEAATSGTLTTNFTGTPGSYTVNFMTYAGVIEQHTATLTNNSTSVTWTGGLSTNCTKFAMAITTSSMFNNRFERLRISANELSAITRVIYAPAWQQKCGTENVYLDKVSGYGIYIDNGYGGAAQFTIKTTEIALSPKASPAYGIYIDVSSYTVGWLQVTLQEVQVVCASAPVTFTGTVTSGSTSATLASNWGFPNGAWNVKFSNGDYRLVTLTSGATTATWSSGVSSDCTISATAYSPNANGILGNGRVIFSGDNAHFEQLQNGYVLQNGANLYTNSVTASGNNNVQAVVNMSASWTGQIKSRGMMKGGATLLLKDNSRSFALANSYGDGILGPSGGGSYNGDIIWPPDPSVPVGSCKTAGGAVDAAPTFQTGSFFSGNIVHTGTGVYTFTMAISMDGISKYRVTATSDLAMTSVSYTSATVFVVTTRNSSGVATDCNAISVDVYHSRS